MATFVIDLPDELQRRLTSQAERLNISLETLVLQCLSRVGDEEGEFDPIAPLIGSWEAEVEDAGERHDFYLGQSLRGESDRGE